MPNAFNFSVSPFDALTPEQQRLVRDSVDIAYYPQDSVVLDVGATPDHLWVIIKGHVAQYEGEDIIATFGPDDVWDGRALVAGCSSHRFVASEELIAYQLPKAAVLRLIAENATFGALLFSDLGQKLSALSQRGSQHEMNALTLSRVDAAFLRPAPVVGADDSVLTAVRVLHTQQVRAVLVRDETVDPPALGMLTNTSLLRAILDGRPLDQLPVRPFAQFKLITIRPSDPMGDALALLSRHRIHRLVVAEGDHIVGMLEALDVFSFLSNQSHLIGQQIDAAGSIEALAQASAQITRMVGVLYRSGTRVGLIARLVQDLQARLFERAWQLIAPPDLVANSCLFVMGSEGRGEQLLKTDQDNGLLLREGYAPPDDLAAICERFSQALAAFGYPECPGHIMVSNPEWRMDVAAFAQKVLQWLRLPDAEALMQLAIFMDAHAVAGDAQLLAQVQDISRQTAAHSDAMKARFAAAIDAFGSGHGWWNRLLGLGSEHQLHLKKEGIFPLVHGVRSLALAAGLTETGTEARLHALAERGVITVQDADDWTQCLHFLMGLKLKAGLAELDLGQAVSGTVDVARLSTLERDLLKDALGVVKHFKAFLRTHFRLDAL